MAIPHIKATYSLDRSTVELLEQLAQRWNTSKSEALRRAIRSAAATQGRHKDRANARLSALDRLQDAVGLTESVAAAWGRQVRAERRAASRRRGA